jgi:hypothetical protein
MKEVLIYLSLNITENNKGVYSKITNKTRTLANFFESFFWINIIESEKIIQINQVNYSYNNFDLEFENILNEVCGHKNEMKIILFRHLVFNKTLLNFFSKNTVLSEHNTKEYEEYLEEFFSFTWRDWFYLIRTRAIVQRIKTILFYKFKAKAYYNTLDGIIGVTNEITDYEKKYYPSNINSCTISNGINKTQIKNYNQLLINNENEVNLLFYAGGDFYWNGFDRLLRSIDSYSGSTQYIIHYFGENKKNKLHPKVTYYESILEEDIEQLLKKNCIGVGTLGLYRKKLEEACPLKVRDYWAQGLPVILGYKDTDVLSNINLSKFVFQSDNNNNLIDFSKLDDFINYLRTNNYTKNDIFENTKMIYTSQKINQLVTFIDEVSKK